MADFSSINQAASAAFEQQSLEDVAAEPETTPEGDVGGEAPDPEVVPVAEPQSEPAPAPEQYPTQDVDPVEEQMQQMQQLQAQIEEARQREQAVMEQNAQLQSMVNELSQRNKEEIIEDAVEMPMINFGDLTYADEETVRSAEAEYAQQMANYVRSTMMKDMQPFIDEAKAGQAEREKQGIIASFKTVPELSDIDEMLPAMDALIARNPALGNLPVEDRMTIAYAMAKGINSMNAPAPKEQTVDDLIGIYDSNPDFRAAIEQKRIAALKDSQHVPPLSASSGAGNAALNIKSAPESIEEANERAYKALRALG